MRRKPSGSLETHLRHRVKIAGISCCPGTPIRWGPISGVEPFPTLDAMERAMIVAAYRKSNRKPIEAARLLGIGKTTFYRKLREIRRVAA